MYEPSFLIFSGFLIETNKPRVRRHVYQSQLPYKSPYNPLFGLVTKKFVNKSDDLQTQSILSLQNLCFGKIEFYKRTVTENIYKIQNQTSSELFTKKHKALSKMKCDKLREMLLICQALMYEVIKVKSTESKTLRVVWYVVIIGGIIGDWFNGTVQNPSIQNVYKTRERTSKSLNDCLRHFYSYPIQMM